VNQTLNFICSKEGVTALEYSILLALIALLIVGAVASLGSSLNTLFGLVAVPFNGS
jgi:pilus assembly protein Flp/PilA